MSRNTRLGLIALAVAVLVAAVVAVRPGDDEPARERQAERAAPERPATPQARPQPRVELVRIRDGEPIGGVNAITFHAGETARIAVESDSRDSIHLHGYDITRPVAPGRPARFTFKANIEGVFELEAHDLGNKQIAKVEVSPR